MINGEKTLRHLLAPVQDVLDDPAVTEIVIQRPEEIGIERAGKWLWRQVPEFTLGRLDAIGILAGSLLSKRFDPEHPICMTTLPDKQRCTLAGRPVTFPDTMSVTIRIPSKGKHTLHDPDFSDMVREATTAKRTRTPVDNELLALYVANDWAGFLSLAVRARKNIAATGATGSGKTSLLRRLIQEIPLEERVITIEDTDEFGVLPQRNRVALFFDPSGITAEHCVEATLRMRPDRVAMQELRGPEVFAYIRLLASGTSGGLTTWHAEEGDPFTPLGLMAKQHDAGKNIPDEKLDLILKSFTDVVAFCRRDDSGYSIPSIWFKEATADA
jgi:type IV secretion system protein VirB11